MKIVIAGNYGAENIGDEMILRGLLKMLHSLKPDASITVFSADPEQTKKTYGVDAVLPMPAGIRSILSSIFAKRNLTRKKIKECDIFILGGGGLFGNLKFRSYIIWGIQAVFAKIYKKPIIMCGQSIDPPKYSWQKWLIRKLFDNAKLIAVRDKESKKELRKLNINKEIHLIPDFALYSHYDRSVSKRKPQLVVALRQMNNLPLSFLDNVAFFLNRLHITTDWDIKIVNFQTGSTDSDAKIHNKLIEKIANKSRVQYFDKIDDPKELIKMFSESKMVLGMRLHSIIAAIKTETPFIAIDYAPKVGSFLRSAELSQYLLDMKNVGVAKLVHEFDRINKEYEKIEENLSQFKNKAKEKIQDFEKNVLAKILQ